MELRQLRSFLAVAETLHFTRAAERLRLAQPALSVHIRQLEEELGVKLFERAKHRVLLTPAGQELARRARFAVEQLEKAAREATAVGQGEAGAISIGFVSSAVFSFLPRLLRLLNEAHPNLKTELREMTPADQLAALRDGSIEAGVMHALAAPDDLEIVPVGHERLIAALPSNVPAPRRVRFVDLSSHTFLLPHRHECGGIHEVVIGACHRAGITPARIQSTRLLQTAVSLVGAGLGVAFVPESFRRNLQVKGVVYRPLTSPPLHAELVIAWFRGNHSPLLDQLRSHLRGPRES